MAENLDDLAAAVRSCRLCAGHLPLRRRLVRRVSPTARVLIAGQGSCTKVHESEIPWNDASRNRLWEWLDLPKSTFDDDTKVAIVPQAFCYPEKGPNGDLPPPPICQKTWHSRLHAAIPQVGTLVLAGRYARAYHLGDVRKRTLSETVVAWCEYFPRHFPVPHPSWHNNHWLKANSWFERDLVPELRERVG
jgi:uracil-DNA glycosylase